MRTKVHLEILNFGKFIFKENREVIEKEEEKDNLLGYVFPSSAYSGSVFVDVSQE